MIIIANNSEYILLEKITKKDNIFVEFAKLNRPIHHVPLGFIKEFLDKNNISYKVLEIVDLRTEKENKIPKELRSMYKGAGGSTYYVESNRQGTDWITLEQVNFRNPFSESATISTSADVSTETVPTFSSRSEEINAPEEISEDEIEDEIEEISFPVIDPNVNLMDIERAERILARHRRRTATRAVPRPRRARR